MKYRRLGSTDLEVSILGFGASPLGGEFGAIDAEEGEGAVHEALDNGVNYFDTAPFYGRTLSETRLGRALKGRRDQAILATKCCRYDIDGFDFSADRVAASIDESLKRLQTDYVDVLLIHDVEFGDRRQVLEEAIPAALRVKEAGKARYVGFSGLQLGMLESLAAEADVDLVLSYARYNLAIRDLDRSLRPLVESLAIGLVNASPLLLGALTQAGPPEWHPGAPELLEACAKAAVACEESGADIAQVALKFCLDYEPAATTLVGMSARDQLRINLAAVNFEIDPGLLRKLGTILEPVSLMAWASGRPENHDTGAVLQV